MDDFTSGAHECFCDKRYKDANKLESCGDCPRDYIAGAWDARRKHIEEHSKMGDRYGGRMNIVFSGPIEGICTRPGLWLESGTMAQPLVYFQKPKWVKNDAAWEKFLRDVFANVRLEARDLDVLRSEVTE